MTYADIKGRPALKPLAGLCLIALMGAGLSGCLSGSSGSKRAADPAVQSGVFVDSPVAGLGYSTDSRDGLTDDQGRFEYLADETVTFRIGDLELGSTLAGELLSPLDMIEGAEDASHPAVINMAVLLQSLDADGDLNNGIQISEAIAAGVSDHANALLWDQPPADFAVAVQALLDELNATEPPVFTDTDLRPRSVVSAAAAREHLERSLGPRKTVMTAYGELSGFEADDETWSWYGIPYAKPPIGELRWRPPVAPEPWDGVREATAWSNQSAQNPFYQAFGEGGMSEDSLYLNVTVPKGYEGEKLPVMVWFHGGGFAILTGNTKAFNNTSLPKEGVIVVTVNHRLGPFGYMAHPALTAESELGSSGNYGQLDLIAALNWVQGNIEAFGGDPNNVTIFGESGGGGKVLSLVNSPLAKGLFHRAIVQSGMAGPADVLMPLANYLAAEEADGVALAELLGVSEADDVAAALRAVPWTTLATVADSSGLVFSPNIDDWYMAQDIRTSYEQGLANDVPLLAGANTEDTPGLIDGFKWYMPWLAEHSQSEVFAYVFGRVPANWASQGVGAYHGIELVYLFDYEGSFLSHYLLGLTGLPSPSPQGFFLNPPGYNAQDAVVSQNMRKLWAQFARTGDPSTADIDWPAHTPENDLYLYIDYDIVTDSGIDSAFP